VESTNVICSEFRLDNPVVIGNRCISFDYGGLNDQILPLSLSTNAQVSQSVRGYSEHLDVETCENSPFLSCDLSCIKLRLWCLIYI
jgi:hypothetical protein